MSVIHYLYSATWFLPVRILLSFFYGVVITLRNLLYDLSILKTHRVAIPVLSVGNISAGGSGKTILVQALIQYFIDQKMHPAVLSRGYGRNTKGLLLVADRSTLHEDPFTAGDEPFLIAKNYRGVPVVVAENRVIGAQYLVDNFAPDVIILDDGFQHRRLARDIDLLLIDQPDIQAGHLLPWGQNRESFRGIRRADLLLYSKAGLHDSSTHNLYLELDQYVYDHAGNQHALAGLKEAYGLFAGLGNPDHFFQSFEQHHHAAQVKIAFPDHTQYGLSQKYELSQITCDYWVTTQKDFIKLDPGFCLQQNIYFIKVTAKLPEALTGLLKQNFK